MSRVFIPQVPSRFDTKISAWVPTVDVNQASAFGEVLVMLPPEAYRMDSETVIKLLRAAMADYGSDDCLLAMGDPAIIATAAAIADRASTPLRMLRWDKFTRQYHMTEINLDEGEISNVE